MTPPDTSSSKPSAAAPTRRGFIGGCAGAAFAAGMSRRADGADTVADDQSAKLVHARRPKPPYRVWFQPRLFVRDIDLYAHMTIDASGWVDPRLTEAAGKTTLDWVYGPNNPYATGPESWRDACSLKQRSLPRHSDDPRFIAAGIALDEWVPPAKAKNPDWLAEGLRAGRKANPDIFIAAWITDPYAPLFDLVRDNTIDLLIIEGYTHATPESPKGLTTSWQGAMRRCEMIAEADLTDRTIFSFGHISARSQRDGNKLTESWLREHADQLKKRYPKMPGVAFYQHSDVRDTPAERAMVRACDRLSADLWPDAK